MGLKEKMKNRRKSKVQSGTGDGISKRFRAFMQQICTCFVMLCLTHCVCGAAECPCNFCGDTTLCHKMGLTKIPPTLMDEFTTIKRLLLHSNKLMEITSDTFINMKELIELDLHDNQITRVEGRAFEGLENLENLHLSGNLLTSIPDGLLLKMPRLKGLFLDRNKLTELSGDILFMKSLVNLNIAQNQIHNIPWYTWMIPSNLRSVLIAQNPLVCDCNLQEMVRWLKTSPQGMNINSDVSLDLCVIKNQSRCGNVSISGIIPINAEANDIFVEKSTAVIQCDAIGNPKPLVVWKTPSGNFVYPYMDTEKYKLSINGTLEIQSISATDRGFYTCYAQHASKKSAVAKGFKLTTKPGVRPSITPEESVVEAVRLTNITLKCEAEGLPSPTIQWYHPSTLVPLTKATFAQWNNSGDSTVVFKNNHRHLIITKFNKFQAGVWKCAATNNIGTAESRFDVKHVEANDNMVVIIIAVVVCIVVIVIIAVIVALCILVRQRKKQEKEAQKEAAKIEENVIETPPIGNGMEEERSEVINGLNVTPEKPKVIPESAKVTPEQASGLKQPFEHEPEVKGIRI